MARTNARLEAARNAYREALEAARASPTPEAWTRLLAAGKELSAAQEPKRSPRRSRRGGMTSENSGMPPETRGISGPNGLGEGSLDLEPTYD